MMDTIDSQGTDALRDALRRYLGGLDVKGRARFKASLQTPPPPEGFDEMLTDDQVDEIMRLADE
jgi:hypothetical protein